MLDDEGGDVDQLLPDSCVGQRDKACVFVYCVIHIDDSWLELGLDLGLQVW